MCVQLGSTPAYITKRALREIDRIVLAHKDPAFRISSHISGTRELREAAKLKSENKGGRVSVSRPSR